MGSPGPYLRATSLASSGGGFTTSMPCSATKTQHQGMKLNIKKKKKQQHTTTTNKLWIWIKRKLQETPAKRSKPLPPTLLHHHPAPTGTHRCPFISTSPRLHPANLAATPPQVSIPPFFVCVCVGFCLGLVPPHPTPPIQSKLPSAHTARAPIPRLPIGREILYPPSRPRNVCSCSSPNKSQLPSTACFTIKVSLSQFLFAPSPLSRSHPPPFPLIINLPWLESLQKEHTPPL